jgi:hypothetical protein
MAATLEKRIETLEAEAHGSTRVAILMPDELGRYPEAPTGAVKIIRVQFVEATHKNTSCPPEGLGSSCT